MAKRSNSNFPPAEDVRFILGMELQRLASTFRDLEGLTSSVGLDAADCQKTVAWLEQHWIHHPVQTTAAVVALVRFKRTERQLRQMLQKCQDLPAGRTKVEVVAALELALDALGSDSTAAYFLSKGDDKKALEELKQLYDTAAESVSVPFKTLGARLKAEARCKPAEPSKTRSKRFEITDDEMHRLRALFLSIAPEKRSVTNFRKLAPKHGVRRNTGLLGVVFEQLMKELGTS